MKQKSRTRCSMNERRFLYCGAVVLAMLFFLCCVCILPAAAAEVYAEVRTIGELTTSITAANAHPGDHYTIVIGQNIPIGASDGLPVITGDITLTTSSSANYRIYRTEAITSTSVGMFTIGSGGKLTITNNGSGILTLDGNNTAPEVSGNTQSLVLVNNGGNFTLAGGTISDNTADIGGGVYVNGGTFTMSGGEISGNTASNGSGGVAVAAAGTFTMSGGTISGNTATNGGGVTVYTDAFTMSSGTFTMSGGTISGNTASNGVGGGVIVSGTFEMSDGTISGNTATVSGGGVIILRGTFEMSGGMISGNTAITGGSGVCVEGTSTFTMSGDAAVGQDNEVYLTTGSFINVIASLTNNGGAKNITTQTTDVGTKVVQLPGGAAESDYKDRFLLSLSMMGRKLLFNESGAQPVLEISEAAIATVTVIDGTGTGTYTEDQTVTIEATIPAGKVFVNWTTASAGVIFADENSPKTTFRMPPNNVTVTATYKEAPPTPTPTVPTTVPTTVPPTPGGSSEGNTNNAFRVIFSDGGSTVSVTTDLSYGDRITTPDEACTQAWNFADGISGDMTLYAKWTGGISGDMTLYAKWTGGSSAPSSSETTRPTTQATSVPVATSSHTASATTAVPVSTTAAGDTPPLTQAPAPVCGVLFGLLAAGVLLRRRA